MVDKINEDEFQNPFVFNIDWKNAFAEDLSKYFLLIYSKITLSINDGMVEKPVHLKYIEIVESFQISSKKHTYYGVLFEVNFKKAFYQHYFMPISFMSEVDLETNTVIAPVIMNGVQNYLVDALHQEDFRKLLFDNIVHSNSKLDAKLNFHCGIKLTQKTYQSSKFMGVEQSNTPL